MAIFNSEDNTIPPIAGTPSDMSSWDLSDFENSDVEASTGTVFRFKIGNIVWEFTGSGFTYDGNDLLTDGTITGFTITEGATTWADVSDFSMDGSDFRSFMNTNNTTGFQHEVFGNDDEITDAYHAIGYEGNDIITNAVIAEGGSGEDIITVRGVAATHIDGGIGSDTIIIQKGALPDAQVFGGSGTDTIMGRWKVDTLFRGGEAQIERMGDSLIKGTNGNNRVDLHEMEKDPNGYTGVTIKTKAGNDDIFAVSNGAANINAGKGNDHVHASSEADRVDGGQGDDHLITDSGDDIIIDMSGDTFTRGAEGNDTFTVADGGDFVDGNENDDVITSIGPGTGTVLWGGAGNDVITADGDVVIDGGQADDIIYLGVGDADVTGFIGDDTIRMANDDNTNLGAGDVIDGDDGTDVVELNAATTPYTVVTEFISVETLRTEGGSITMTDGVLASGAVLEVEGGDGIALDFDGSAETNAMFVIIGTDGDDTLVGGARADEFHAREGDDTIDGGGGDDSIHFTDDPPSTLSAGDSSDGGTGTDTMFLAGLYSGANALNLGVNTMISIEKLVLEGGSIGPDAFAYDITLHDGNVASGGELTIDSTELHGDGRAIIDGSAETNGRLLFVGGDGGETFIGGGSRDEFTGGGAGDQFTGNGGGDLFKYHELDDSTSRTFDTITAFNASEDSLGFEFAVGDVETAVEGGALSRNTFDNELENAIGAAELGVGNAVLFTPDAGFYSGHKFLVVDANGQAGYQGEEDFVLDLTGGNTSNLDSAFQVI